MTFLFLFSVLKKTLQRTANECRNEISLVFLNLRNAGISSFEQKTKRFGSFSNNCVVSL